MQVARAGQDWEEVSDTTEGTALKPTFTSATPLPAETVTSRFTVRLTPRESLTVSDRVTGPRVVGAVQVVFAWEEAEKPPEGAVHAKLTGPLLLFNPPRRSRSTP
ncbi:hypothetical protein [Vitiosangium sp. GDMCC 1.1324]|uniref:hypothetical protein n=1 Tax=Vitiosangium sp. (strain GDMCC 1.1324) TaxID=2138576 RepID=UPI0018EEAD7D|nr:hypothetical protein [Vitiosangium sp. GDMCC 1.1324]